MTQEQEDRLLELAYLMSARYLGWNAERMKSMIDSHDYRVAQTAYLEAKKEFLTYARSLFSSKPTDPPAPT